MIRKSIIAVLLTCTVGVGALWAASYCTQPRWHIGDQSMRHSKQHLALFLRRGKVEFSIQWREDWEESMRPVGLWHCSPNIGYAPMLPLGIYYYEVPGVIWRTRDAQDTSAPLNLVPARAIYSGPDQVIIESQVQVLQLDERPLTWNTVTRHDTYQLNQFKASTKSRVLVIPLWMPCLLFGIYPTLALTRTAVVRHRRRRNGLCLRCGYDLTGNISGVCSECGRDVNAGWPAAGRLHR